MVDGLTLLDLIFDREALGHDDLDLVEDCKLEALVPKFIPWSVCSGCVGRYRLLT